MDNKRLNKSAGKIYDKFSKKKSIIGLAKENVFEFPVFVADSVPLEYATATNSLIEQVYASYLQMAISIDPIVNAKDFESGRHLKKFKTDTNQYLEHTDMTYAHEACHNVIERDECIVEFDMTTLLDEDIDIIVEHFNYEPLSEFNHYFQEANDDNPTKKVVEDALHEAKLEGYPTIEEATEKRRLDRELLEEKIAETKNKNENYDKEHREDRTRSAESHAMSKEKHKDGRALDKERTEELHKKNRDYDREHRSDRIKSAEKHRKDMTKADNDIELAAERIKETRNKNSDYKKDHTEDRMRAGEAHDMAKGRYAYDTKTKAPQFIDETKIQKLNTMKPLLMTVNVRVKDEKSGLSDRPVEYIIGVKTFARLIDADILPEVAKYPLKEMHKIKRRAKWRAGELKFFKDIIFKIKEKKQSAFDARDKKRKWYRRLYELAHKENYQSNIFKGKAEDGIPNATIIISQSDVINIKSQTGIDMFDGNNAVSFCKELFLMSLVVVDSDAESIKVLVPDLHDDFEIHSIASINKQLSTLDTSGSKTRDILKLFK